MTDTQICALNDALRAAAIDLDQYVAIIAKDARRRGAEVLHLAGAAKSAKAEVPHDLKDGLRQAQADAAGAGTKGCRKPNFCLCDVCAPNLYGTRTIFNQEMLSAMLGGKPL